MKLKFKWIFTLLLALSMQFSFAQEKTVTGVVSDNAGLPLPGVSVLVKGTKTGTQTDFDGKYSIKASSSQILVFSYIGMKTQEVVASSTSMNVKLKDDSVQLEGVVINTFGVESKRKLTNTSMVKVKGDVLRNSGETGLLNSLSGKGSGVNIAASSGDPGAGSYVQIRGQNTITGNTQPLYVIDGIPISSQEVSNGNNVGGTNKQSRVNDINPNSIESVQILKGASASALWGYRGANGVILITTKKGKGGKLKVELSSTYSNDEINVKMKTQDIFGQGAKGKFARNVGGSYGDLISSRSGDADAVNTAGAYFVSNNGNKYYQITKKNSRENFNDSNYDAVIGTGNSLNTNLSLSGGNENGSFYLGLSHLDQTGVVRNSSYERTNIDFSTTYKLGTKTTFKGKVSFTSSNSNRIQQGSNTSGLYLGLYRSPADFDNRDFMGTNYTSTGVPSIGSHRSYRKDLGTSESSKNPIYNNPLWSTDIQKNPNTVNRYISGFELKHDITENFSLLGRFGLDAYTDESISVYPVYSAENAGNGFAFEDGITYRQYNADVMGIGNVDLTSALKLDYTVGLNIAETNDVRRGGSYKNFLINTTKFVYSNSLLADRTTYLDRENTKTSGAYFSGAFDYKEFLNLNLGGRFETSSTLSPNTKVYFYPSIESSYTITHHLKSDVLTFGKLRATYGEVAIMPQAYRGASYITGAGGAESWGPAYDAAAYNGGYERESVSGNANLKPEIKTEFEVGTNLEFFNRLKVGATYYNNTIKDNLAFAAVNPSSSFSDRYGNLAQIENHGIELDLDYQILSKGKFKWNTYANWSTNKNEVTKLVGTSSITLNGFSGVSSRAVLNQPLGVLWGGRWDRDASGKLILDANGFPTAAPTEGVIGNPNAKWRAAIGNKFEYKGISLDVLFDASIGGQLWDGTNGALAVFGKTIESANILNLTSAEANALKGSNGATAASQGTLNTDGTYSVRGNIVDYGAGSVLASESWYTGLGGGFGAVGEQFVKSASWVKLRQVALGYSFNTKNAEKIGLDEISVSLTGRNLWLWTEDKTLGQDPETNLTGGTNGRGLQYFNSPNTRSFLMSINLKF
ncbi:SusC/RagA family TonB-linked outer membrane protein [Flavobacterium rhamnosiphilum]|uniref:SusC/RagA family TonB-linked outer membrane protein n=1 Tax=Flavobacterium rhamnosiphilum TaxID=2541724 RepID=A0A4R5F5J9_9FLAO|nr:SusC/RagA family TonB-linked outer membrane protein [Flavobacterium rhamnosiphilum]TDE42900.1 SusC/RagA family TonB-linked outer membrane protein [Flavobacterium rhamnosiphilum]